MEQPMSSERDLKNRICIATMCGHWERIADDFGAGVEIDYFCQAENMDGVRGEKVMAEVDKIMQKRDVRVLHAPFNELFPASIDPKARELAMNRLSAAADIATKRGIKKMVVHSGYMPFTYFKQWHISKSITFWKEFMEKRPDDFEICIENVLDDEPYMLAEIAEKAGDPRIGLCYDVGHANIKGKGGFDGRPETTDQKEWLEVTAPYLKHVHIHNNDGKRDYHRGFEEGTVNIEELLDGVIMKCASDTTITAELLAGEDSFRWLSDKGFI